MAVHHHVDHAVLEEILGPLEAIGKLFADRLLDDARAGEADQRAGFGKVHVAEHGVGRGDAAGGRVRQHDDVGELHITKGVDRHRRARKLHQREHALLHAGAARGGKEDERLPPLARRHQAFDHRLARRHAERAAHEVEILDRDHDRHVLDIAGAEMDRVDRPGLGAGVAETVGIAALVAEFERIDRRVGDGNRLPLRIVEEVLEALPRRHPHVIAGAGDDVVVRLEVAMEHHLAGLGALDPEILRHLPLGEEVPDLWTDDVADPAHDKTPARPTRRPRPAPRGRRRRDRRRGRSRP